VAEHIGKHASTVSRATASKFVLLPSGKLISFDKLFAPAIAPKTVVAELLAAKYRIQIEAGQGSRLDRSSDVQDALT
jgi:DNA-directed RNA polymerase specialized sigma54-like protein